MKNPIPRSGLFATRTLQEIQADIESLPPQDKAFVYPYVMATLNACHVLTGVVIEEMTYADGEAYATGFDEGYAEAKANYEREEFDK